MIIYVDIDDTICYYSKNKKKLDYSTAKPIVENINKINKLYDEGNTITYWTARGTVTGIDWTDITKEQLNKWNAKYHNLKLGKPNYDIFIDDKALNSKTDFNLKSIRKILFS